MRLPSWEIRGWKSAFDVWGPLDWRRDDWRDALNAAAAIGCDVEKCVVFPEPTVKRAQTVDDIMNELGAK